jgi:hypothetical protein
MDPQLQVPVIVNIMFEALTTFETMLASETERSARHDAHESARHGI